MVRIGRLQTSCSTLALLALIATAREARAQGEGLAFLSAPTEVKTGRAESFMNMSWDWNGTDKVMPANVIALPTIRQQITVRTWRSAASACYTDGPAVDSLCFTFTIPDFTTTKPAGSPGGVTLSVGDQILIQVDPNNSKSAELEFGTALINQDRQYGIVIKGNAISELFVKTRGAAGNPNTWLQKTVRTNSNPFAPPIGPPGNSYTVNVGIPFSELGLTGTSSPVGLAIAVINDLGNTYTVGTVSTTDLAGSAFPVSIILSKASQPGLIDGVPATGGWVKPNTWGIGYFAQGAGGVCAAGQACPVALSHEDSYYFSKSIKLATCNAIRWDDIDPADTSGVQSGLKNWYLYNNGQPCKMGMWVRGTNTGTGSFQARFLIAWADGGLGMNAWRAAALTPAVTVAPGQVTFTELWANPPAGGSGSSAVTHACVRVYVLPATLNGVDGGGTVWDETRIKNLLTDTDVANFETAYLYQPNSSDMRNAQMNFTNLATGSCANPACAFGVFRQPNVFAYLDDVLAPPAVHAADLGFQERTPGGGRGEEPKGEGRRDLVSIWVDGFGVAEDGAPLPYRFVENIGGLAWAIPMSLITTGEVTALGFKVGNPALLARDFSVTPAVNIPAPPRRIFLSTRVEGPPGMRLPRIDVELPKAVFQPGEVVTAQIGVQRPSRGSFTECLRGGGLWCWLIVVAIVVAVLVLIFLLTRARP